MKFNSNPYSIKFEFMNGNVIYVHFLLEAERDKTFVYIMEGFSKQKPVVNFFTLSDMCDIEFSGE